MKKLNKKGFTLAELLIVVAIIAVLVAVAIPVFNGQLEKAREATDAANLRVAYATASVKALEDNAAVSAGPVKMTQTEAGFTKIGDNVTIAGKNLKTESTLSGAVSPNEYYVTVGTDGTISFSTTKPAGTIVDPVTGK